MFRKPAFVPHPNYTRWTTNYIGWQEAHLFPFSWNLTSTQWTAMEQPTRQALVRQARKLQKKKGTTTLIMDPGQVITRRPVGTRIGKGKGRAWRLRRWTTQGNPFLQYRGATRPAWRVLFKKSPRGALTTTRSAW